MVTGRFNGVWSERIADIMDGFDYDPDAVPTGNSWADFLGSVLHLTNPDAAPTTSYEFEYHNERRPLARLVPRRLVDRERLDR